MSETLLTSSSPSDRQRSRGRLIVVTGPSGVGKGTLLAAIRRRHPELQMSISATTRSPRPGEIDGVHYFFYTREQFESLRDRGQFLEWAEFAGNLYGTPLAPVKQRLQAGEDVILEIELQGARQVARTWPEAFKLFIRPPSLAELERRLRERGQDTEESIQKRLATAELELKAESEFDLAIVNDRIDRAVQELETAILDATVAQH
ncbi:guanylate kinase [Synechococcus sp. PCC 7336]|uniref:guanylate kinase n=1 Tax=Synechococcus sp. PCC 7336 TaxID=195250 RepID=UPI000346C5C1|nr:guanylate kinase [Synechococcus sp. PCC 7336]